MTAREFQGLSPQVRAAFHAYIDAARLAMRQPGGSRDSQLVLQLFAAAGELLDGKWRWMPVRKDDEYLEVLIARSLKALRLVNEIASGKYSRETLEWLDESKQAHRIQ